MDPTPERFAFGRLPSPTSGVAIHHVTSSYAEMFWLPYLGPTALWLLRHVARRTETGPFVVEVDALARCLGVGVGGSSRSPLPRTCGRLVKLGCASSPYDGTWLLAAELPTLSPQRVERLPGLLVEEHARLLAGAPAPEDVGI